MLVIKNRLTLVCVTALYVTRNVGEVSPGKPILVALICSIHKQFIMTVRLFIISDRVTLPIFSGELKLLS